MQILNFDRRCEGIERVCSRVNDILRYSKKKRVYTAERFVQTLNNLIIFLLEDNVYSSYYREKPLWHTAYRIVRLINLNDKIKKIVCFVNYLVDLSFLRDKIIYNTIPFLSRRISDLQVIAFSTHRLPFFEGVARRSFLEKVSEKINHVKLSHISEIEKDYFHLIGNHLDSGLLKNLDLKNYVGSLEVHGLLSWSNILKSAIHCDSAIEDKEEYEKLLKKITQALPFALKLSFLFTCLTQRIMILPDREYYEDVVRVDCDEKIKLPLGKIYGEEFDRKYSLDFSSKLSLKVLENEISWDMVNTISLMKKGDVKIFFLGVGGHRLVVQLTCTESGLLSQDNLFQYQIFNTGLGVNFHKIKTNQASEIFAYPLTYSNVPGGAFSFTFCAYLILLSMKISPIDAFYMFHEDCFSCFPGVRKSFDLGKEYPIQKYGICAYMSLEVFIKSYLNEKQTQKIELIKTVVSIQKQDKIVSLLENSRLFFSENQIPAGSETMRRFMLAGTTQKLKESRFLLDLGKKHLFKLHEEHLPKKKLNKKKFQIPEMRRSFSI